ncbi:neurogenic locus notch homolog protein 3-like isoform X2 [Phymastichus coffea]|uniref:neurogenic locus notch homolog protein 3-like isoform X2 n=1 Tax=Phymastichus coffea TaxID=108790 RepID=UPI00273CA455|nr:neurogenic locus notch homolog protein 3-like isoform X2 [Phymastichus coffea]
MWRCVSVVTKVLCTFVAVDVGCDTHTCGINARCSLTPDGRPVCACLNLHRGDPLGVCEKVECSINEDCYDNQVCQNNKCVNPCSQLCGTNALCSVRNHHTTCSCPSDHTGDPFKYCSYDPQAPCKKPDICGANSKCEVIGGTPTCSCLPGFVGSAIAGCRHECETDYECGEHRNCVGFRCEDPCQTACGSGANCKVRAHRAVCTCPEGWLGNALSRCYPECQSHSECPAAKPACYYQKCANPCQAENVCGVHANCELRGFTPVCSCPRDMTGDPFKYCRPFNDDDLCHPNPCGQNAECNPGHDSTGRKRPVCTCPSGFFGNALHHCQRGECSGNADCPHDKACIDYSCANPCTGHECGNNADCQPKQHIATCVCRAGYRGDALYACHPIADSRALRYLRYTK